MKYNGINLLEVLHDHGKYLLGGCKDDSLAADFSGMQLPSADFTGVDLSYAKFDEAKIPGACFSDCTLNHTSFKNANLHNAKFVDAVMEYAYFEHTDLARANFDNAIIKSSVFDNCWIDNASFSSTHFTGCIFDNSDIRWGNWDGTRFFNCKFNSLDLANGIFSNFIIQQSDLLNCSMEETTFIGGLIYRTLLSSTEYMNSSVRPAFCGTKFDECEFENAALGEYAPADQILVPMACPDTGSFIGWKKVHKLIKVDLNKPICGRDHLFESIAIVKLLIPEDARRCSAGGRKCRCDKAIVLDIQEVNGKSIPDVVGMSSQDAKFLYKVGEVVRPDHFTEDRFQECSHGIHFFITRAEALDY